MFLCLWTGTTSEKKPFFPSTKANIGVLRGVFMEEKWLSVRKKVSTSNQPLLWRKKFSFTTCSNTLILLVSDVNLFSASTKKNIYLAI